MAALKLASVELARGDVETALARIDRWLERHPDDREARSAHLIACQYSRRYDAAALLAEHRRWKPDPAKGSREGAGPHARPGRPARIGWVSPRFCHGPVEVFFAEVLKAMCRDAEFEHTLYMTAPAPPESTERFRRIGATWRDAAYATDGALLDRIREDRIDILVDLAGAGPDNRLAVFAARAAPLQASWLDYFCTTGLGEIDYLITDDYLAPAGCDAHYSETLLRLTPGRLCYTPPPAPAPSTEGVEARRLVCLNRFSKINDEVAAAWSAALLRLPGWSLRLKGTGGDDAGVANALRRRFEAHGVDPERLDISGEGPYAEAIDAYRDTAVALDPFPFSGCATSFDALWMGLPVVTLPLDTMASRQTGSLLSAIGREDWIADDVGAYVDAIVDVARDEDGRRRWRAVARERMRPLTDTRAFARELTAALPSHAIVRLLGVWMFLLPVFVVVCHRMIPFFTANVVPFVTSFRPWWLLAAMVAAPVAHGLVDAAGLSAWTFVVDLPVAILMIAVTVRWGIVQSLANRLLAMLHLGFVWFGTGFALYAISSLAERVGANGLGFAPMHALTIGFASSLLMAMVTRVTCGHTGRTLQAEL